MNTRKLRIALDPWIKPGEKKSKIWFGICQNVIDVEPGRYFNIPANYEGKISNIDNDLKIIYMNLNGGREITYFDKSPGLAGGRYLYHFDGRTIEALSDIEED